MTNISEFNEALDTISRDLIHVKSGLNGIAVRYEDDDEDYFLTAMDVYESIDSMIEQLLRLKHDIVNAHIGELESQLQDKLKRG